MTPPELSADILPHGNLPDRWRALLRGLDQRICSENKITVHVAEDPFVQWFVGTGIALKNIGRFKFLIP